MLKLTSKRCFLLALVLSLASIAVFFSINSGNISKNFVHEKHYAVGSLKNASFSEDFLKSSVDSLAFGLEGLFASSDNKNKEQIVANAFNSLAKHNPEVHYTVWDDSLIVYSSLTPDIKDVDFSRAMDVFGNTFVGDIKSKSKEGGFLILQLPDDSGRPIAQLVYAKAIGNSNWHIAAFVLSKDAIIDKRSMEHFNLGMKVLAWSLAGMAFISLFIALSILKKDATRF